MPAGSDERSSSRVARCCCATAASIRSRRPGRPSIAAGCRAQQFDEPASELVFADLIAAVDGLTSRKAAIALRLSALATDERWWPTVARLRSFRGIDTLTALSIHLELGGDWQRFERAAGAVGVAGVDAVAEPVRRVLAPGLDHQDRVDARPPAAGRVGLALQPPAAARRDAAPTARPASPTTSFRSQTAPSNACTASTAACAPAASRTTSPSWPARASWPASSGPPPPPTNPGRQHSPVGGPGRRAISGRHARHSYEQHPPSAGVTLAPRQHTPAARNRALRYPTPASSDWQRRHRARRPGPPTTLSDGRQADAITHAHLTTERPYQLLVPGQRRDTPREACPRDCLGLPSESDANPRQFTRFAPPGPRPRRRSRQRPDGRPLPSLVDAVNTARRRNRNAEDGLPCASPRTPRAAAERRHRTTPTGSTASARTRRPAPAHSARTPAAGRRSSRPAGRAR